ncbi:MAG: hypothetical protein ACUVQP_10855 [Bacteroidales bacterium]
MNRTTISQHFRELMNARIIRSTIDGLKNHYCLDSQKLNGINVKLNTSFFM